jgi:small subunit ribosomal protein S6
MNEHYELTYIVPIKYIEGDLDKVNVTVKGLLKEAEGEITKEDTLGKKKLAYPINHVHQGTYMVYEFDMPRANLLALDGKLSITNEVLRHLIAKKKVRTVEQIKREEEVQARIVKDREDEEAVQTEQTKEKIEKQEKAAVETVKKEAPVVTLEKEDKKSTLDDLDKKLDEILKDDII